MTVEQLKEKIFKEALKYSGLACEAINANNNEAAWEYSQEHSKYFNAEMVINEILKSEK